MRVALTNKEYHLLYAVYDKVRLLVYLVYSDAESIQYYTVPHKGRQKSSTNIANITLHTHDLPHDIYNGSVQYYSIPPKSNIAKITFP